jgi:dTDP-4-amino-4,6-dideoxygalactose transaminase
MTADVKDWGYKFHMNDVAAAIGLANLELFEEVLQKHRASADYYRNTLYGVQMFSQPKDCLSSDWVFGFFCENRKLFMEYMTEQGIEVTPMWRRNDEYSTFAQFRSVLPNMDIAQNKVVFVPTGWWLTQGERTKIADAILNFFTPNHWM